MILRVLPSAPPRVLDAVTMSREQMVTAAGFFFCVEATACTIVSCARRPRRSVEVLAAILYARLLNGVQHRVLPVLARKYSPGGCLWARVASNANPAPALRLSPPDSVAPSYQALHERRRPIRLEPLSPGSMWWFSWSARGSWCAPTKARPTPTEYIARQRPNADRVSVDGDPADSCNRYLGSGDGYGPVLGGA